MNEWGGDWSWSNSSSLGNIVEWSMEEEEEEKEGEETAGATFFTSSLWGWGWAHLGPLLLSLPIANLIYVYKMHAERLMHAMLWRRRRPGTAAGWVSGSCPVCPAAAPPPSRCSLLPAIGVRWQNIIEHRLSTYFVSFFFCATLSDDLCAHCLMKHRVLANTNIQGLLLPTVLASVLPCGRITQQFPIGVSILFFCLLN